MSEARTGSLRMVATPIGNLGDVTLRAIDALKTCDAVLAEDTRRTRILLDHLGIATAVHTLNAHASDAAIEAFVARMLDGETLALVTDAGTPIVSDPGSALARRAAAAGVPIVAIPGPSAVTAALTVAALPCDTFRFVGFLPRAGGKRSRALAAIAEDPSAIVLFESPQRIAATLRDLALRIGERRVAVCRELTKLHEEVRRGTAAELAATFEEGARGEITVVIEANVDADRQEIDDEAVDRAIESALAEGKSARDVAREIAESTGLPKRDAYERVLAIRGR